MPISKAAWQRGLDSHTACNLSGLAHWLPRLLDELRANNVSGTDALNTHAPFFYSRFGDVRGRDYILRFKKDF